MAGPLVDLLWATKDCTGGEMGRLCPLWMEVESESVWPCDVCGLDSTPLRELRDPEAMCLGGFSGSTR